MRADGDIGPYAHLRYLVVGAHSVRPLSMRKLSCGRTLFAPTYGGRDIMFDKRFQKVYSQGTLECFEIWVDKETGVNYLYHAAGYGAGLTPLLGRDGKPVVTHVEK